MFCWGITFPPPPSTGSCLGTGGWMKIDSAWLSVWRTWIFSTDLRICVPSPQRFTPSMETTVSPRGRNFKPASCVFVVVGVGVRSHPSRRRAVHWGANQHMQRWFGVGKGLVHKETPFIIGIVLSSLQVWFDRHVYVDGVFEECYKRCAPSDVYRPQRLFRAAPALLRVSVVSADFDQAYTGPTRTVLGFF